RLGPRVLLEEFQKLDLRGPDDRVAADADAGRLRIAHSRKLEYRLVSERARPTDDAHAGLAGLDRLVDVAGHDAGLALTGSDDARAVRSNEPYTGFRLHEALGAGHVEDRDALGDRNDYLDAGIGGFHNRIRCSGRGYEDHTRIRARLANRLGNRIE